jgi:hypothetical protein
MDARRSTFGLALAGALAAATALGCREDLLAPATGTCPDFCPPEQLQVVDTILLDNVTSDSSFVGYVLPHDATSLQVYRDSTAAAESGSRVVLVFLPFSDTLRLASADTNRGPVIGTDSFTVRLPVRGRNLAAAGLELLLYRIPVSVDSATTYAELDPYFADSTFLAEVAVPDSVADSALTVTIDPLAFPDFAADSNRAAIGVALRNPSGYVQLGAIDNNDGATLTRYVQVDSAGTPVPRNEGKLPDLDTFVGTPASPASETARAIGGAPAARTMLRFDLPIRIVDSSAVVRATLELLPAEPVLGAPADSLAVIAQGLATDVGAKSPLQSVPSDSVGLRIAFLAVGSMDTVRLDVTDMVIGWTTDSTVPRALAVRAIPEGGSFAELRIGAVSSGALRPRLHITFVPPLRLGER